MKQEKTKVSDVTGYLESQVPLKLQESYDNAGLIVGNTDKEVKRVLVCLDSTEAVIDEAIRKKCDMVIAHHPIVFKGLKKITGQNYVERTVLKAIKNDIAIYAIHTNLDNVDFGVNSIIMAKLGIKDFEILSPKGSDDNVGAGMVGNLTKAMGERGFLEMTKTIMRAGCVKHTKLLGRQIKRVAVCGGAGSFLVQEAIKSGADVFVTSDFTYHQFFDADGKILIADIGHYESEQFTHEAIDAIISYQFPKIDIVVSSVRTNPVHYF